MNQKSEQKVSGVGVRNDAHAGTESNNRRRMPSRSTLMVLVRASKSADLADPITALQSRVRNAYTQFGVGSEQYEQPFDDLHWCRRVSAAFAFRAERGLPPDAHTPYDDADLKTLMEHARGESAGSNL